MKTIPVIALTLCLLAGCGYSPEKPAYDTAANPKGFPAAALDLINKVESGELTTYRPIIDAFGDLYTNHSDLLENRAWLAVVEKLGAKFRYRADSLAARGIKYYTEAAGLYQLAAFARPYDDRAARLNAMFTVWSEAVNDRQVPSVALISPQSLSVAERVDLYRHFLFADSSSAQFADLFLRDRLFEERLGTDRLMRLNTVDRAFLAAAGIVESPRIDSVIARFEDPGIELVACAIATMSPEWYRLEAYFRPVEDVDDDLTVAFRIQRPLKVKKGSMASEEILPFDFKPQVPSTEWPTGRVMAAYERFYLPGSTGTPVLGLYTGDSDSARFVHLAGETEYRIELPETLFVAD